VQTGWQANLTGIDEPVRLQGQRVTGEFFTTLRVPALMGRTLQPGEDSAGHDRVAVLSYDAWRRVFGGASDIVGRSIALNGESYEVVGVMPSGFRDFFNRNAEVWAPLVFDPEQINDENRTTEFLNPPRACDPRSRWSRPPARCGRSPSSSSAITRTTTPTTGA
jgi:hypothetical protein